MNDKNKNGSGQDKNNSGKRIIIAERDNIAAVKENGKVSEFFIHRGEVLLGDVYLATVENILPSIDAAFVNVGTDKMGFLHAQDVMGKGALKDKLKPKQKLVVQVVKEPTGHKGPRVTTEISLPGRFLVLMPNETGINVSRKIESVKEKARLKSVVNLLKPVGVGVIVRTEAEGQTEADIQEDLEILLEKWNNIVTSAESLTPPNLIYRDQDLLYRVIREACSDDVDEIIVDTAFALNRVQNILQNWHMNKNTEVTLYKGTEPLLIATDIHKEIKAALQTKVNMPSGGYLYIQTTEALTVIDVNSGKFVSSATQDETILKTNIEAVHEIARQLRLRNIGGMIIVDFIDMNSRADKLAIMEELEIALEPDKAKPQVGQLSDLGLVELTRHRQGQALAEIFSKKCPHCQGQGFTAEEFNFASPTAEGEYRAKAAKLKLPVSNFKKNGNNKFNKNQQNKPQEQKFEEAAPIEAIENPSNTAQNEVQERENNKKRNNNRRKFDKNKVKEEISQNNEIPVAETVLQPQEEIKAVIETKVVPDTETETKTEAADREQNAKLPSETQETAMPLNASDQAADRELRQKGETTLSPVPLNASDQAAETVEEPQKTRRPNRGGSKKPRAKKEEKTEVEAE